MSRAVLIIIADFLLISLLSLANFEEAGQPESPPVEDEAVDVEAVKDMQNFLEQALEEVSLSRSALSNRLAAAQAALVDTQTSLQQREEEIAASEQRLEQTETEATELQQERERLQQEQEAAARQLAELQRMQAAAENDVRNLQNQLSQSENEASVSKARAEVMQAELTSRREEAKTMQQQITVLQTATFSAQEEKARLAVDLQRVETQVEAARSQLDESRERLASLNAEKERLQEHTASLVQGMDQIATESVALAEEIREDRELAPNTIYNTYLANRVESRMKAEGSGVFGITTRDERIEKTVLFREGDQVYALYHIRETLLPTWGGGPDWNVLNAILVRGTSSTQVSELCAISADPRIVVAPLDETAVQRLNVEPYALSEDPSKFQFAVLAGRREGYYGEVEFRFDPALPSYLRMFKRTNARSFGKFAPSLGDLVFSKAGELLGIMVNSDYCAMLQGLRTTRTIKLGQAIASQSAKVIGSDVATRTKSLPLKLQ